MQTCTHGVQVGRFCAKCPKAQQPYYVYSRDAVIALNPIRKAQGQVPLTGREVYEMKNGTRTGRVLNEKGEVV